MQNDPNGKIACKTDIVFNLHSSNVKKMEIKIHEHVVRLCQLR